MFRAGIPMAQSSRLAAFSTSVSISVPPRTSPMFQNSTNCTNVSNGNPVCSWVRFHSWRLLSLETLIIRDLGEKFLFWVSEKSRGPQAASRSEQSQSFGGTSKKWIRKAVGITQHLTVLHWEKLGSGMEAMKKLRMCAAKKKLSWMMLKLWSNCCP